VIYVGSQGAVGAIDATTGESIWEVDTVPLESVKGSSPLQAFIACHPVPLLPYNNNGNAIAFLRNDGVVFSFVKQTGERRWTTVLYSENGVNSQNYYNSFPSLNAQDGTIYVVPADAGGPVLWAINPSTGAVVYNATKEAGGGAYGVAAVYVGNNHLLSGNENGLWVRAADTGETLASFERGGPWPDFGMESTPLVSSLTGAAIVGGAADRLDFWGLEASPKAGSSELASPIWRVNGTRVLEDSGVAPRDDRTWTRFPGAIDANGRYFILDSATFWVFGCLLGQTVAEDGIECASMCRPGYEMRDNVCCTYQFGFTFKYQAALILTCGTCVDLSAPSAQPPGPLPPSGDASSIVSNVVLPLIMLLAVLVKLAAF
jgi:hypothetical protein